MLIRIQILIFYPSRIQGSKGTGSRIPDPQHYRFLRAEYVNVLKDGHPAFFRLCWQKFPSSWQVGWSPEGSCHARLLLPCAQFPRLPRNISNFESGTAQEISCCATIPRLHSKCEIYTAILSVDVVLIIAVFWTDSQIKCILAWSIKISCSYHFSPLEMFIPFHNDILWWNLPLWRKETGTIGVT